MIHLAVKFSDDLFGVGNVMERHLDVLSQRGHVWLGKFGAAPAQATIDVLTSQVHQDIPTWIWLLGSGSHGRSVYRGEVETVTTDPPEDATLVPAYYSEHGVTRYIGFWMLLRGLVEHDKAVLQRLAVRSSGRLLDEVASRSMSGFFIVSETKGAA